jgi:excisionase family DNA binding protein
MPDRALTVRDVAEIFGVRPQRVYGWLKHDHITALRLPGGGGYRFRPSDIQEFEERCRGQDSKNPTTDSDDAESAGTSTGLRLVELDPFQRGRQSARKPRDGGTNG